jgi:hypothetical protein
MKPSGRSALEHVSQETRSGFRIEAHTRKCPEPLDDPGAQCFGIICRLLTFGLGNAQILTTHQYDDYDVGQTRHAPNCALPWCFFLN